MHANKILQSLLSVVLILNLGCRQIPTSDLSNYREAFSKVQEASDDILIDYEDALRRAPDYVLVDEDSESRLFNDVLPPVVESHQPSDVEVRRLALRTIDRFNDTLVMLSEGQSVDSVQKSANGFIIAAGNLFQVARESQVPGLAQVASAISVVAAEIERARLRAEFEDAVRDGAPIIDQMLSVLIEDRSLHLTLRKIEADSRHIEVLDAVVLEVVAIRSIFLSRSASSHGDDIEEVLSLKLKPMENALNFSLPVSLSYGDKVPLIRRPLFGIEQRVLVSHSIRRIEELVASHQANIEKFEKLKAALNSYGVMLSQTRTALERLVESLDTPQDFEDTAERLLEIAFRVKSDIEAYRTARDAVD